MCISALFGLGNLDAFARLYLVASAIAWKFYTFFLFFSDLFRILKQTSIPTPKKPLSTSVRFVEF